MSIINLMACKFAFILSTANVLEDPLLKNSPLGERVEPEMTEEIDDLVKDSLNLVILLERALMEFQKDAIKNNNRMGQQLVSNCLLELEDIEAALSDPALLNFDFSMESGLLDVIDQNASMIKSVLDMTRDHGGASPEFKNLDDRVYKWINELIANNDKIHDLAMRQSTYMESVFRDDPTRMVEQVEDDVDEIDPENIHPDYDDSKFLEEFDWEINPKL